MELREVMIAIVAALGTGFGAISHAGNRRVRQRALAAGIESTTRDREWIAIVDQKNRTIEDLEKRLERRSEQHDIAIQSLGEQGAHRAWCEEQLSLSSRRIDQLERHVNDRDERIARLTTQVDILTATVREMGARRRTERVLVPTEPIRTLPARPAVMTDDRTSDIDDDKTPPT